MTLPVFLGYERVPEYHYFIMLLDSNASLKVALNNLDDLGETVSDISLSPLKTPELSSYDRYMGRVALEQPERFWLDVQVASGKQELEESAAVHLAMLKLAARGIQVAERDCEVLHVREFRYSENKPFEVDKSKIMLILVGGKHLVSIHDGDSCGIREAQAKMISEGFSPDPLNVARLIIERSLDALADVEIGFDRLVSPLLKKVTQDLLSEKEYEDLTSVYLAVEYIRRRISMMRSGVARSTSLSMGKVNRDQSVNWGPGLDSLLELLNSHEDTCKQISESIKWTWQLHSDLIDKKLIEEQEEANRIQQSAEERKQRSDARWQLLGGISVPLGLGLAVIQSFQLSSPVGIGIMAATSVISAALVYFRNDDFSWLYDARTDRWASFVGKIRGMLSIKPR